MREISLKDPKPNGFVQWDDQAVEYHDAWNKIKHLFDNDRPIFVKFVRGDRKESIARFVPDPDKIRISIDNKGEKEMTTEDVLATYSDLTDSVPVNWEDEDFVARFKGLADKYEKLFSKLEDEDRDRVISKIVRARRDGM